MKYLAPIIIALIVLLYIGLQGFGVLYLSDFVLFPVWVRILIMGALIALVATFITMLVQSLKEIKEDDEDDLSKY